MNRIETVPNEKKSSGKALKITKIACSVIIVILALLQLTGIWDKAINVFEPLLGVLMLLQALEYWRKNRKVSILSLGAALFVFICVIIIFFCL